MGFYLIKGVTGSNVFFWNSCQHLWKVDWNEERENEGSKTSEEALVTVQVRAEDLN